MSDPITPKADRHVIDGKVTSTRHEKETAESSNPSHKKPEPIWVRGIDWVKKWSTLVAFVGLFLVILYLIKGQNNQDWQINHINALQTRLTQLTEKNQTLTQNQQALQKALKAFKTQQNDLAKQPAISMADVNAVKAKVAQLEQQLADKAQQATQALMPSDDTQAKVNQQLQSMGQQIIQLKDKLLKQLKTPADTAPKKVEPLNNMQIQQWIVALNTQWVLKGNVAQTHQGLLALEQAIGLSNLPNKLTLVRLIGEDIATLNNASAEKGNDGLKAQLQQLKTLIKQLPIKQGAHSQAKSADVPHETSSTPAQNLPAMERLKNALTGLFSIKKLKSEDGLTQVDSLILKEVVKQKGSLWVDQLNWAMQLKSNTAWQSNLKDLKQFVMTYYPKEQQAQILRLITPLEKVNFKLRQALKVMGAL